MKHFQASNFQLPLSLQTSITFSASLLRKIFFCVKPKRMQHWYHNWQLNLKHENRRISPFTGKIAMINQSCAVNLELMTSHSAVLQHYNKNVSWVYWPHSKQKFSEVLCSISFKLSFKSSLVYNCKEKKDWE